MEKEQGKTTKATNTQSSEWSFKEVNHEQHIKSGGNQKNDVVGVVSDVPLESAAKEEWNVGGQDIDAEQEGVRRSSWKRLARRGDQRSS